MKRSVRTTVAVSVVVLALGTVAWAQQEQDESPPLNMNNPANLITITATTYTLNHIAGGDPNNESHLDGQWICSRVASDGKVYFGDSSHDWKTGGMFCQYDPATRQVHVLCPDIDVVCGEKAMVDANQIRPQGKLHSDLQQDGNYLYFATYYGYTGAPYTGGHVIRYQLGSYEAGAAHFDNKGIPNATNEIYGGLCVDSINHKVYVNSGYEMYRMNCDAGTTATPLANLGGNDFFQFTDSQGNLWATSYGLVGTLFEIQRDANVPIPYYGVLPLVSLPSDTSDSGTNTDQTGRFWNWGAKWGSDKFVFNMRQDGALYVFDAAKADANDMGHAFTKVAHIGIGGLDMCLGGNMVYFVQSATPWGTVYTDPITHASTAYIHDAKARDQHLMSISLTDPNHVIKDCGRLIDPVGRVPWRTEGMSADDNGHVYLTGDWHLLRLGHDAWGNVSTDPNVALDPNEIPYGCVRMIDSDPGHYYTADMWRGQFFAVVTATSNQALVVFAGANQSIALPSNTVTLAGTVSDDGTAGTPTATWSALSGPGSVTFANVNAPGTTATFSTLGTYVLQLAASDSARSASSTVQIIVNPQPVHQAPVVSAGSNQTITLPTTTATLAGTVSDDGLAGAVTSTWSVVSGPGSVTFANANAPGTTATFSTLGTYVLKLTATDPALSGSAQMQVVVQPQGSLVLALHLPFDEGSGTTAADTSGNGRNGTLSGGTTWITGKIGHALQFNGTTGEVTVPDFPLSQQFSVAFWFKASNLPNMYSYMFSWGTVSNVNSINIWFYVNGAITLRTDIQDSVNADPTNYCDIIDANMANGQWHHYCATVANGTGLTVYIDGQSRVTYGAVGGHTITPATNLFIGSRDDNNSARYFAGSIDDVRIYSQALSASDVQNLYNAAPVVTVAPPPYTHNYPRAWMQSFTYPWTLAGSVSDDGLPNPPGACTVSWSTVSGPGTVTFDTPNQAVTTAVFSRNPSAAGNYVLMLDANDGQLDGNVQVTVIVMKTADFSGDGKLDGIDFLIWQAHYPTYSGASPWEGDANGDGKVDGVDFLTWQANYHG